MHSIICTNNFFSPKKKNLYKQIEQWIEGYEIVRGITSLSEGDPARH